MNNALDWGLPGAIQRTMSEPPTGIVAVVCSDSVNLTKPIHGFMVTTTGAVTVTMIDGTTGAYPSCSSGVIYPGVIKRVWSTGTDASTRTGIIGFY